MTAGVSPLGGYETDLELETLNDALGETRSVNEYDKSILLDILKWSDYPEANDMVQQLDGKVIDVNSNKHEKYRKHLKVVLLNLYAAYIVDPVCYVAIALDKNKYAPTSRYNALKIAYEPVSYIVHRLHDRGLIKWKKGFKDANGSSRVSRIRADGALLDLLAECKELRIARHPKSETIILKNPDKSLKNYKDTVRTHECRDKLRKINAAITSASITLDLPDDEFKRLNQASLEKREVSIDFSMSQLYRVFNNGSFTQGGRFYGGWWQLVPEEQRKHILIDGEPTVELDYKALHPTLLYLEHTGHLPDDDPYVLESHRGDRFMREVGKSVLLIAINAKDSLQGLRATRKHLEGKFGKDDARLNDLDLEGVIEQYKAKHNRISRFFYTGYGTKLQFQDSLLAERIMLHLAKAGIVCLPIHDSFVAKERHKVELLQTMEGVFEKKYNALPGID